MNKKGAYRKKLKNMENVRARREWLLAGIDNPEMLELCVQEKISSQRGFAALAIPNKSITSIALNTMKKLANELFSSQKGYSDGFAYFDSLRLQLYKSIKQRSCSRSTDSESSRQADVIKEQTEKLRGVQLQSIFRSKAYIDLLGKVNNLLKDGEIDEMAKIRLLKILHGHNAKFGKLFDPPASSNNTDLGVLVMLAGGRNE